MAGEREVRAERVKAALAGVVNPRVGRDVLSGGQVAELEVGDDGVVRLQFLLHADDPGSLVREVRAAVEAVPGVERARIDVKLPQAGSAPRGGHGHGHGPAHAPAGAAAQGGAAPQGGRPGAIPVPRPGGSQNAALGHVVAVSSGKGGVGKSTVAANLAAALASQGRRVGLLDADVYGPDIPLMFGERRRPSVTGERGQERIVPLEAHGVKLMSLGFLLDEEQPAIMRGPLVTGILKQFLEQVEWGELDYLLVDMPPGTGDAQLSLAQTIELAGAVMVTTPQEVSTGDVRRAVRMFEKVRTRVLGIVENMSGFSCPHCSGHVDVFGRGGGRRLAEEMGIPFLAEIPLAVQVREAGDLGKPTALSAPGSEAGRAFLELAERLLDAVEGPAVAGR
jgi:ATP-binding protein involved in chromosome partitioning